MGPTRSTRDADLGDRPPRASWRRTVACLLVSVVPLVAGVGLGIPESRALMPDRIDANGGVGYSVPVPPSALAPWFDALSDDVDHPHRSSARLTEDGRALGPPHTLHALIAVAGGGLYSHWGESLLFSASDSSDPRTNGRHYMLHLRERLPFPTALAWIACFAFGALVSTARVEARPAWVRPAPAVGVIAAAVAAASSLAGAGVAPTPVVLTAWLIVVAASLRLASIGGRLLATQDLDLTGLERARRRVARPIDRVVAPLDRPGWRWRLARILSLGVGAAGFVLIVQREWPASWLLALHDDHVMLFRWVLPALLVALWRRGWVGTAAPVAIVLVVLAFPLAARWQDVSVHGNAIGGLLPFSDARGYWLEANRLLDGEPLQWAARRPAFTAFLSTLLALTGRDLASSLVLLVLMNGVAIALLGIELRRSLGPLAGAVASVMVLAFYAFEGGLGTTLTENIGLAVAALGFAVMVRATRESRPWLYAVGVGLLTMALIARAGAFFVLPLLAIAGAWEFRTQWRRAGAAVTIAVAVAALVTIGSGRLLSAPAGEQQAFSNFSYSLYGLVVGGKGWQQVVTDHPNAREGAEIYALAWQAFKSRPAGLLEGAVRMWTLYIDVTSKSAFQAFVFLHGQTPPIGLYTLCYLAAGLGLVLCIGGLHRPLRATLLAGLVGHLASIPFVPPIDAGLRVYAATMPIVAAVVAFGAAMPVNALARLLFGPPADGFAASPSVEWPHAPLALGLVIVLATTLVPQVLLRSGRLHAPVAAGCGPNQAALTVRVSPASQLDVVPDDAPPPIAATRLREAAMRRSLAMIDPEGAVAVPTPGQSLVGAYEVHTGAPVWLVTPTAGVPAAGLHRICASPSASDAGRRIGVYSGGSPWLAASAP